MTDVVSEFYGQKRADFLVLLGFAMGMLALHGPAGLRQTFRSARRVGRWRSSLTMTDEAGYQKAFESVFSINGTLLFASMSAYLSAQLIDNRLFHFWKRLTKGRHLWLRNNGSTMISQLVDTVVVGCILYYWGFGMEPGNRLFNHGCDVHDQAHDRGFGHTTHLPLRRGLASPHSTRGDRRKHEELRAPSLS